MIDRVFVFTRTGCCDRFFSLHSFPAAGLFFISTRTLSVPLVDTQMSHMSYFVSTPVVPT